MTQGKTSNTISTSAARIGLRSLLAASIAAAVFAAPVSAQGLSAPAKDTAVYAPSVGQAGKDVVWVPTPDSLVTKMLDIAKVTPNDRLIDLGSGDGRTVIAAAKRGLTAHGIEYEPQMADLARRNIKEAGVSERATITTGDLFEADLTKAEVITMFLLPSINEKLRPELLKLRPGTRIVSNSFHMGDWEPDQSETVTEECKTYCTALLWIVPAQVDGNWKVGDRSLSIKQFNQTFTGKFGDQEITDGRLDGPRISFTAGGTKYTGTVDGNNINGSSSGSSTAKWTAKKA